MKYADSRNELATPSLAGSPQETARQLLEWAFTRWGDDLTIVTSFQATGVVILDLASRIQPTARVVTIDTGRLPEATQVLSHELHQRYSFRFETFYPRAKDVQCLVRCQGPNLFYDSVRARQQCCRVRKVLPLRRALEGVPAWITGMRRDTASRAAIEPVERDPFRPGVWKVQPLAMWSWEDVWEYTRFHSLPYHEFYDRGYTSIGCAPCTRPPTPGLGPRSGRWWWERRLHRECGIHSKPIPVPGESIEKEKR